MTSLDFRRHVTQTPITISQPHYRLLHQRLRNVAVLIILCRSLLEFKTGLLTGVSTTRNEVGVRNAIVVKQNQGLIVRAPRARCSCVVMKRRIVLQHFMRWSKRIEGSSLFSPRNQSEFNSQQKRLLLWVSVSVQIHIEVYSHLEIPSWTRSS